MANLKVNFAGVEFKNPLVLASAAPSWDGEGMRIAGLAGIGGVVPKTIGPIQDWAAHPRNGRFQIIRHGGKPIGMVNLELFTTKTREAWIKEDLAVAKEGGAVIQASILAMPNPDDTAVLVDEIQATGMVDVLELNVSCPMPAQGVGMHIGKSPELTFKQAKAAKSAAKIPLTVKLTPTVFDMVEVAMAVKEAGAEGVTISNSIRSFAGVDIETGKPLLRAYGGYSGPAIKPIVMRHLSEVARKVDLPISAIGGVMSFKEIVEYIMLGATTVQTATAIMWNGYGIIGKWLKDLEEWMDLKGYQSLDEIRGIALPYITTTEELAKLPPMFANIDEDKCTNCGICQKVCMYRAISSNGNVCRVSKSDCDGCGACVQWCPSGSAALA
ncbi:dihydropyrimidine dehydrogenase (NAD+) subunit PreA [Desulfotomaculum arcticum]|uniref:Dihydroorotate dehydrogenase B (NAD(+)), catalytic subunit n=1 Tax=Desulfotruncus arcticus DSM 17038 TaxID=1121424 RepID=A0A1I2S4R8_9FIRM|nr:4Fe-4S binding protein [Desulfotruncus arcticus]SFG47798.1 dihydropyrimidine dehydrogenase (NAD+) subunit PreA [Desulfotomaculum arcticum] [Desulfotruncus arcticus DSM 17038]